ncbi:MAG TPA: CPBP family intramembrane glutamic endopeptidase [Terriglobales bacterium]|nr:CPBP family intramembrane glutamic endopeptidase [Terriglobales bacterium]
MTILSVWQAVRRPVPGFSYEVPASDERGIRIRELLLVSAVALAGPVMGNIFAFSGSPLPDSVQLTRMRLLNTIVSEMIALAVLAYVLGRRSWGLRTLGFSFSWFDLPMSLAIGALGYFFVNITFVLMWVAQWVLNARSLVLANPHTVLSSGVSLLTILVVIINPFFEELILRSYFTTEIAGLTNRLWVGTTASVIIQTSLHAYQGPVNMVVVGAMFVVFSVYFAKTQRILPIILAHMYFDIWALLRASA